MTRVLSISFAFLLITEAFMPNMDMCELKKIDNLFEHYRESARNYDISLVDFIKLHYGSQKDGSHHSDEHDGDLPFQGSTCCPMPLFVTQQMAFSCQTIFLQGQRLYPVYQNPVEKAFPQSIFQPPRES